MKTRRQNRRKKNHYHSDLFAENLEARILYSGSPAPDIAQEVFFESIDTIATHSFSTIDEFADHQVAAVYEETTNESPVVLLSFDNLSENEVASLLIPSDEVAPFVIPNETEVEVQTLPVVTETEVIEVDRYESEDSPESFLFLSDDLDLLLFEQ